MGTKNKTAKTSRTKKSKVTKAKKATDNFTAFNISVPTSMLKKIDVQARKANLPRSAYVRQQLQSAM